MKNRHLSKRAIVVCIISLAMAGDSIVMTRQALGRAGSGGSYRSAGSSSRSSSGSRSYSGSTWRSGDSRSSSSGPSGYSSTPGVSQDYDDPQTINSWNAVLTIDRGGAVDVIETYDVTTSRKQKGVVKAIRDVYNTLWIKNVSCDRGYAKHFYSVSQGHHIAFGYVALNAPGRHVFTLKYHAMGMVIPAGTGSRFQWIWKAEKPAKVGTVRVVLPPGLAPLGARAAEVVTWDRFVRAEKELPCSVAGNSITVAVNRDIQGRLDVMADLPAGSVDAAALRTGLMAETKIAPFFYMDECSSKFTIHDDRTVDREDVYRVGKNSVHFGASMYFDSNFHTALWPEGSTSDSPRFADNRQYLYAFEKKPCAGNNSNDYQKGLVCVPLGKTGEGPSVMRYSQWGNFGTGDPFFFDLVMPAAKGFWTDRTRFEIAFPPFVKKERVRAQFFLVRGLGQEGQIISVPVETRWDGNRLTGEYNAVIFDNQGLQARIFLPAAGFKDPGFVRKIMIRLSSSWYFNRVIFITVLVLIGVVLSGALFVYMRVRKKKFIPSL